SAALCRCDAGRGRGADVRMEKRPAPPARNAGRRNDALVILYVPKGKRTNMTQDTIAACSGGALPAAIGIVRLSGPDTGAIIDKIFVPKDEIPITKKKTYHLYYGKLLSQSGKSLDLCLA